MIGTRMVRMAIAVIVTVRISAAETIAVRAATVPVRMAREAVVTVREDLAEIIVLETIVLKTVRAAVTVRAVRDRIGPQVPATTRIRIFRIIVQVTADPVRDARVTVIQSPPAVWILAALPRMAARP
jgi:hypothetical protein